MLSSLPFLDFQTTNRFQVIVDEITFASFSEFTLPTLQVETMDIKEGGQNTYTHKLPVRVNNGTVTLKSGVMLTPFLLNWYIQVLEGDIEGATRSVVIAMFDVKKIASTVWWFDRAYPIKWTGPTLKANENTVAIESLELAFHGFGTTP